MSDQLDSLSYEKSLSKLKEKIALNSCSQCSKNDFMIIDIGKDIYLPTNGLKIIPIIVVSCSYCGYLRSFSKIVLYE